MEMHPVMVSAFAERLSIRVKIRITFSTCAWVSIV